MRISDWSSDVCSSDLHCGDTERSVGIDRPADIDRAAAAAVRAHLGRYLPVLVPVGLLGHPVDHAAGTAAPEDHAVGALERLDPLDVIEVAEVLQVVADAIAKEVRCRTVAAKDRRTAVAFALGDPVARDLAHELPDHWHHQANTNLFTQHAGLLPPHP